MLAALLVPVLVAAVPPLSDYPNHLARIWLLSGGAGTAPVSGMYRVTWDTLTNIGIDLVAAGLGGMFGYETMGRLFVAASVLLAPLGGIVLWRVLHGRFHWWQLSFGLLAWSLGVILGFLNFEIGIGLALLAAALDPALVRRGGAASIVGRAFLGGVLLLVHAFAFVFYAFLLCGIALGPAHRLWLQRGPLVRTARSVAAIAATLALPLLAFVLLAPALPGSQTGTSLHSAWLEFQAGFTQLHADPTRKLYGAFAGILAYANWVDKLTLVALAFPVLLCLVIGRLTAHAGMLLAVGGLLACYVICPFGLADALYVDSRFALMAALALAVALRPELPPRPAGVLAATLLTVSLLRTGSIGWVWHERQADVAAVSRALAPVPPGAAVLPLEHHGRKPGGGAAGRYITTRLTSYGHLPTLALPWRQAFVPTLFTGRGKQPVQVRPPFDEIASPDGGLLASVDALTNPDLHALALREGDNYLRFWHDRFDYALVLNADVPDENGPFVPPPGMALVRDEGFARLYRIDHPHPQASRR